jgi:hypothetical protein
MVCELYLIEAVKEHYKFVGQVWWLTPIILATQKMG